MTDDTYEAQTLWDELDRRDRGAAIPSPELPMADPMQVFEFRDQLIAAYRELSWASAIRASTHGSRIRSTPDRCGLTLGPR